MMTNDDNPSSSPPKEEEEPNKSNDGNNEVRMIALYYWYVDLHSRTLPKHKQFQIATCNELDLKGRIRVSAEGINGVLSGTKSNLEIYEDALKRRVAGERRRKKGDDEGENVKRYGEMLDVKYCHLRKDVPIEKQLFDSLSVKITKEVVSLNEDIPTRITTNTTNENKDVNLEPARHLSPKEWNEHLLSHRRSENDSDDDSNSNRNSNDSSKGAVLLDARNGYESRIGHFTSRNIPTVLANTRKYSSLPSVLRSSMEHLAGKDVYMYCTGGVRCERASVYLKALAESESWPEGLERPGRIYQLEGGIQKYLESYGTKQGDGDGDQDEKDSSEQEQNDSNIADDETKNIEKADTETKQCLFKGKNFVFDPRRYDPVVGTTIDHIRSQSQSYSTTNDDSSVVGKCVICGESHDDYDNGCAPSDNNEARCCRCRVLVLVCNTCREKVQVWKPTQHGDDSGESDADDERPKLYCGPGGKECVYDGNKAEHFEVLIQ